MSFCTVPIGVEEKSSPNNPYMDSFSHSSSVVRVLLPYFTFNLSASFNTNSNTLDAEYKYIIHFLDWTIRASGEGN